LNSKNVIAIITARGGSKRIPRKNIKDFCGKPIIQYSIQAAIQSGCFNEVMVSTDDKEIAAIALTNGASVPFMRSEAASNDYATTVDTLNEVFREYSNNQKHFDYACCIYPTAPFVTPEKIRFAFEKLLSTAAISVMPIVKFGFPIMRSFKLENGLVKMNWSEHLNTRSQDLEPAYHDAGQFYFFNVKNFLSTNLLFTDHTIGIEMPESEVQDIDTLEDWKVAELKYSIMQKSKKIL
jgi:pseudaminic acid cytidylyltransferase